MAQCVLQNLPLGFVVWGEEYTPPIMNTEPLHDLLARYIHTNQFDGAAVVASRSNEILIEHYVGQAGPGLPASASVLWPLASISKMYAVSAIMRLIEQGQLTLNRLVSEVIPEFSGGGREEVRLRQLLTHTSGLIYESPQMEARLMAQTPLEELIREAFTAPLLFKPGSMVRYADYNTLIAGEVASRVTGKPLEELVRTLVLEPMGLKDTFFPAPAEQDYRTATVRGPLAEGTDGAMYNSRYGRGLAHPAFAVAATVTDLHRFGLHFAPKGPRVLSERTVNAMRRNQTGIVPGEHPDMRGYFQSAPMPWGLGWALQTEWTPTLMCDLGSQSTFGHGGASGCFLVVDPEAEVVIALVSNAHIGLNLEAWMNRQKAILNLTYALVCGE
jgi:serine-type D-Ala-D-Ala carboxypeptidase